MPSCSITQCRARKNKNQPHLTLHRFPKNELMKRKWIDAIGVQNINPLLKQKFVCSLHFEKNCFNTTLDVTRLHDNSVPSIFGLVSNEQRSSIFNEKGNLQKSDTLSSTMHPLWLTTKFVDTLGEKPSYKQRISLLSAKDNVRESDGSGSSSLMPTSDQMVEILREKVSDKQGTSMLRAKENLRESNVSGLSCLVSPIQNVQTLREKTSAKQGTSSLSTKESVQKSNNSGSSCVVLPSVPSQLTRQIVETAREKVIQEQKLKALTKKCIQQRQKIKRLNEKVRHRNKKIANLKDILEDLKNKNKINAEQAVLIEECAGPKDFLKRQIAKSQGLPVVNKYSEEIRKFALTLHFLSPKAYNYIRRTYNTCLPHTRTLCKWYQHVDAEPGFTKEAFETLKIKAKGSAQPLICSLSFDEMAIRKSLTWDPKAQKYYGRVDYGQSLDSDTTDVANQALVLLLTSINGTWKIPIGYFFITSLTGEQKGVIVQTALQLCEEVGVKVVNITCDGPAANFSMFSYLGCDILKNQSITSFESGNMRIHAFIDPCHTIKLIRNAFGELRVFMDSFGRKVDFKYLEMLLELQEEKSLYLANKLSKSHIFFQKQKMKVKLATQLLSNSVADALKHCRDKLKLNEFEDCSGTINFINIVNDVFDVLNSHSIHPPGWKKAMCPENIGFVRALFDSAISYIENLKLPSGELLIRSRRKTGFLGLIINMKSALALYEYLVEDTKMLKYIPFYKISQDHLELFFSAVRARGGLNNNPNAVQFRAAYKKLLVRAEIRDDGTGNCIPLEQINILNCSSKMNPIDSINELTAKQRIVDIPEDHSELYDDYIENILINSVDAYTDGVIEYIAGFVTKKILNTIKCDICASLLMGEENVNSLIYTKSRGGLKYASSGVIETLKKTEKLIKLHLNTKTKPELYYLYIFQFLFEYYEAEKTFYVDSNYEHNNDHRLLLIKSVIKTYIDIRFRHHGRLINEKVSYRQFLNKLILFRNE